MNSKDKITLPKQMSVYKCEKCDKTFDYQGVYERHIKMKGDCTKSKKKNASTANAPKANDIEIKEKDLANDSAPILRMVKHLHDVLRSNDAIIGQSALNEISKMLFLTFIQPYLDTSLKSLMNPKKYEGKVKNFNENMLKSLKLSFLDQQVDLDYQQSINVIWQLLGVHDLTSSIFTATNKFKAKISTIRTCLKYLDDSLKNMKFNEMKDDVKSQIYEYFINGYSNAGKDLGQFFTPRHIIKAVLDLNLQLFPDFKPNSIYDPCAGTGGFITEAYKKAKNHYKVDIRPSAIRAIEIQPETYTLALMNLLLTVGKNTSSYCGNSYYSNDKEKYNWIVTNPPFGLKMDSFDFKENMYDEDGYTQKDLYQFETNNLCLQIMQHCLRKLKKNGVLNIVIPTGEIIDNIKGNVYKAFREFVTQNYQIAAVISLDNRIFKHAEIYASIIVIRNVDEFTTTKFYKYDAVKQECEFMIEVDQSDICDPNYNWNYKYYLPEVLDENKTYIKVKKICKLIQGDKASKSTETITKDDPDYKEGMPIFVTKAKVHSRYTPNSKDYEGEGIYIFQKFANSGIMCNLFYYNCPVSVSNLMYRIELTTDDFYYKYIYYMLKSKLKFISNICDKGSSHRVLNVEKFMTLSIPVIPKSEQLAEIKRFDADANMDSMCDLMMGTTYEGMLTRAKSLICRTDMEHHELLGDCCTLIKGTRASKATETITKDDPDYKEGMPIFVTKAKVHTRYTPTSDYEGEAVYIFQKFANSGVMCNAFYYNCAASCSNLMYRIQLKTNKITYKYLYYFILLNLYRIGNYCDKGSSHRVMNTELFNMIRINYPSKEEQKMITDVLDSSLMDIQDFKKVKQRRNLRYINDDGAESDSDEEV